MTFLARRVAVLTLPVAALALLLPIGTPLAAAGVLLGAFTGVYKLRLTALFLGAALGGENAAGKGVLLQLVSQLLALGLLIVTVLLDAGLFFGAAAGMLLVPLVICVNAITEKMGLTHNSWGGALPGPGASNTQGEVE